MSSSRLSSAKVFVTRCAGCKRDYPHSYKRCPKCKRINPRHPANFDTPIGARCAKNDKITANVARIIEFDQRFQRAMSDVSISEMLELADWAQSHGLTLARKAQAAAMELRA